MARLEFPQDTSTKYPARIRFRSFDLASLDVAGIFRGGELTPSTETDPRGDQITPPPRPSTASVDQHRNGNEVTLANGREGVLVDGITLYLPQAIQIADGIQYDNINLGVLGGAGAAALAEGAGLGAALASGIGSSIRSLTDAFKVDSLSTDTGRLAVNKLAGRMGAEIGGAVSSSTLVAVNPNTRSLFKQVNLREFSFTFKLIPTNPTETQAIKDIILSFRTNMYPEAFNIQDTQIPAGYKFPAIFEIDLLYGTKQLATKILPSYLKSFNAVYNGSGMGFLEGGDFSEVDISLSFVESATLTKQLVQQGY
tara:strand:+ start:2890 stop:3822 length:933 start_codon:yes stop_codon:yes gene_type:complete